MERRNDRGGVALVCLLIFLGILIWAGFRVGQLYFDRSTIENEIAMIGDDALTSRDANIGDKVERILRRYDARFDKERVAVEVNPKGDRIRIRFPYERSADLIVTQVPFQFSVDVEREGGRAVGVIQSVQDSLDDSAGASARKYQKAVQEAQPPQPSTTTGGE
jgi:hypothetical protein